MGRRCVVVFALLVCLLPASPNFADETTQQKARLDELKRSIATVQKNAQRKSDRQNRLAAELRKVEIESGQLSAQVRKIESEINSLNRDINGLQTRRHGIEQEIHNQSDAIAEELVSAFKLGRQEPVKLLLNQEDPQRMARIFRYYDYFVQARAEKIRLYESSVAELESVVETINSRKLALAQSKQNLEQQNTALLASSSERQATLKKLNAELKSDQDRLRKLGTERDELQALIDAVEKAIADLTPPGDYRPFVEQKGKLLWPLDGKVQYAYGSPRSGSLRWQGWLLGASGGEPVRAVHHGRVVFSDYLRGFGLLIIIDHGADYMTLYAHNQELLKDTGDWVNTGETIARAGNSGGLDSPALYFEIRRKGQPADPKIWLARH